jgi:hypothetical protein
MKTFASIAAQGEITIRRIGNLSKNCKLPSNCVAMKPQDGCYIVGHSETGHHHVIDTKGATIGVMDHAPEGMRVLYAILEQPFELKHLRQHDTHETLKGEPGVYEIRIGREFDPYAELARRQAD